VSRYTRTNTFPSGQKARGGTVQAEFDAVQEWAADMPDSEALTRGNVNFVAAAGTANALTVLAPDTWTSYTGKDGFEFSIKIATDNTGAATLNIDGLGAKACVRNDGSALQASDLKAAGIYNFVYNESSERFHVNAFNGIAVAAASSASAASASASSASGSADTALSAASSASSSQSGASTSATLSMDWAIKIDGPVADGEYSSKYWAQQAAIIVGGPYLPLAGGTMTGHITFLEGQTFLNAAPGFLLMAQGVI
jgi:hypothetical protein